MTTAAEKGYSSGAMNDLAVMYGTGNGVDPRTTRTGRRLVSPGDVSYGSVVAAANLAHLYKDGNGVQRKDSRAKAEELFEAALNSGHGNAPSGEALAEVRERSLASLTGQIT